MVGLYDGNMVVPYFDVFINIVAPKWSNISDLILYFISSSSLTAHVYYINTVIINTIKDQNPISRTTVTAVQRTA